MDTLLIYILGAGLYGLIEIAWRGWTHWSMLLCGGACFTGMYIISSAAIPLWAKCLLSAALITAIEFCTGYLVNIILGWHVWDYSNRPHRSVQRDKEAAGIVMSAANFFQSSLLPLNR